MIFTIGMRLCVAQMLGNNSATIQTLQFTTKRKSICNTNRLCLSARFLASHLTHVLTIKQEILPLRKLSSLAITSENDLLLWPAKMRACIQMWPVRRQSDIIIVSEEEALLLAELFQPTPLAVFVDTAEVAACGECLMKFK